VSADEGITALSASAKLGMGRNSRMVSGSAHGPGLGRVPSQAVNLDFTHLVVAREEHLLRLARALDLPVPRKPKAESKHRQWHRDLARMVHGEIQRRRINDALGRTRARGGWET
jgi:hypothetical protein